MEKRCVNCKYRAFRVDDKFKTYGFCTKKGIKSATFRVDTRRDGLAVKIEDKVPKQCIPACLNVQTYYEGNCPYYDKGCEKMELTTKYHIVPINDGYTYLCLNSNSGYELHEKAEKLPSNLTEILFNNEQTTQRYINENLLNPQNYKPEAIYINEELYFKR